MKTNLLLTAPFVLLAACQSTGTPAAVSPDDALRAALVGQTLTVGDGQGTNIHPDGTLSGGVTGTWEIKAGQWCRTITAPKDWVGTQCQAVMIDGSSATFTRPDGRSFTGTLSPIK